MRQESPRSGLRGLPLLLARSAALLVSAGVVILVAARAGVAGCKSTADIGAEAAPPSGAADTAGGPAASGAPAAASGVATATKTEDPEVGFMGGSKAPAGKWAFPSKPTTQTATPGTQAPNAPPQTPPQAPRTPQNTAVDR